MTDSPSRLPCEGCPSYHDNPDPYGYRDGFCMHDIDMPQDGVIPDSEERPEWCPVLEVKPAYDPHDVANRPEDVDLRASYQWLIDQGFVVNWSGFASAEFALHQCLSSPDKRIVELRRQGPPEIRPRYLHGGVLCYSLFFLLGPWSASQASGNKECFASVSGNDPSVNCGCVSPLNSASVRLIHHRFGADRISVVEAVYLTHFVRWRSPLVSQGAYFAHVQTIINNARLNIVFNIGSDATYRHGIVAFRENKELT